MRFLSICGGVIGSLVLWLSIIVLVFSASMILLTLKASLYSFENVELSRVYYSDRDMIGHKLYECNAMLCMCYVDQGTVCITAPQRFDLPCTGEAYFKPSSDGVRVFNLGINSKLLSCEIEASALRVQLKNKL